MYQYLFLIFAAVAVPVLAHQPFVIDSSEREVVEIESPTTSYAFYGELTGQSQTFELSSEEPFKLLVQVLEPALDSAENNHSAIITHVESGEVVAELDPADATWQEYFEFFGGDYYLKGPEYIEDNAQPGTYQIEVMSADNTGKYVLVTGTVEDFSNTSIFATVGEIYQVKRFFEKTPLAIFQTPFVYVPTALLVLLGLLVWFFVRRRHRAS